MQNASLNLAGDQELETKSSVQNTTLEVTEHSTNGGTMAMSYDMYNDKAIFPFPNQVPMMVLEREYLLIQERFQTSGAISFNPFINLLGTELDRYMRNWRYFRFDVQLRVQIIAPITTFGYLKVWWDPWDQLRSNFISHDFKDFAVVNGAYLAIADNEALVYDVKWTGPFHMASLAATPALAQALEQGSFHVETDAMHRLDEAEPEITVQVFGRCLNPIVQGPIVREAPAIVVKQMMVSPDSSGSTLTRMSNALPLMASAAGAAGTLLFQQAAAFGSYTLGKAYNQIMTNYGNQAAEVITNAVNGESKEQKQVKTLEQNEDNERMGVRQTVFGDLAALSSPHSFQNIAENPNCCPLPDCYTGSAPIESDMYGLLRRWAYYQSIDMPPSQEPPVLQNSPTVMNCLACPWRPASSSQLAPPGVPIYAGGYADWFSRFFRLWRGSIEFKFVVFAPPLVTYKFAVGIFWENLPFRAGNLSPDPLDFTGPVQAAQFDARGTTEYEITVPFLRDKPWDFVGDQSAAPWVILRVLAGSPGNEVTASGYTVPVLCFWRMGPDFRYRSLSAGPCMRDEPPLVKKQGFVNGNEQVAGHAQFGTVKTSFDQMAFMGNISDLIRRPSTRDVQGAIWTEPPGNPFSVVTANQWQNAFRENDILDIMSNIYVFNSGSYRLKASFNFNESSDMIFCQLPFTKTNNIVNGSNVPDSAVFRAGNGSHVIQTAVWPVVEFEVPFIGNYIMENNTGGFPSKRLSPIVSTVESGQTPLPQDGRAFITPGDDFAYHILLPPPLQLLPIIEGFSTTGLP